MDTATGSAEVGKSSTGMNANLAALLSYVLGVLSGVIFFLVEKESKFVKFHAMQSIGFSLASAVASLVLAFIPIVNVILLPLFQLAALVVWIILMVLAYQGKPFRLPVLGDVAAKQAGL
jgi:uncharacterized membrane protein